MKGTTKHKGHNEANQEGHTVKHTTKGTTKDTAKGTLLSTLRRALQRTLRRVHCEAQWTLGGTKDPTEGHYRHYGGHNREVFTY